MSGAAPLLHLAARWRRRRLAAAAGWGLALGLPLAAAALTMLAWPAAARWAAAAAALALPPIAALLTARREVEGAAAVGEHLDRRLPALAESSALLLADAPLPPLQELQRRRAADALAAEDERALFALLPWRPLRSAALATVAGLALAAALVALGPGRAPARGSAPAAAPAVVSATPRPTALLRRLEVTVTPPAYTGRRPRRADTLAVRAEEGSRVTWRVEAAPAVTTAWLLVDERERVTLREDAAGFTGARAVREPHLVRLVLAGAAGELWRSPPARIEAIPDRPPALELLAPATLVERPPGAPGAVTIELAISDDYGVRGASLLATLATGTDELVEFRDQTLPLPARIQARRQVVRRTLDLAALGLTAPGAELFVRAEVRDNRRPQANVERSPTVVVRLPVERVASADLAAGIPMLVGPELLRSQRQIVVDTERLLAEAPRLAAAEVARRSRALALDQRAVRMRYGVLLGDEFVEGRAVEADEEHGGAEGGAGAAIADLPGAEVHLHDSAESATYFPEAVRQRLQAMLAAMWDAEGQLAVDAPRVALPHERRALELLKQVQQASRVYVQKSGVEGAPLDPTRRLGGELEGVRDVTGGPPRRAPAPVVEAARRALQELATLGAGEGPAGPELALDEGALATLRPALAARARGGDEAALAALPALDELAAGRSLDDVAEAALLRSLWSLLPAPETPARAEAPGGSLWERYRRQLAEGG